MQSQTTDLHNVKLNIHASASKTHNSNSNSNNELTKRAKIKGTPFYIIKQVIDKPALIKDGETQYFLVMGDYRLTEPTLTEEETIQKLETEKWLIITNIIAIATQKIIQDKIIDESITARSNGYELSEEFKQHAKQNGVNL